MFQIQIVLEYDCICKGYRNYTWWHRLHIRCHVLLTRACNLAPKSATGASRDDREAGRTALLLFSRRLKLFFVARVLLELQNRRLWWCLQTLYSDLGCGGVPEYSSGTQA